MQDLKQTKLFESKLNLIKKEDFLDRLKRKKTDFQFYNLLNLLKKAKNYKKKSFFTQKKVINFTVLFKELQLNLKKYIKLYRISLEKSLGVLDGAVNFFNCIKILLPIIKIIKKKKSGAIHELPRPLLNFRNSLGIAIKNLVTSSLKRKEKTLVKKLTKEIMATLKKKSLSYYNKLEIYEIAKKGRPFLHLLNFKKYRIRYTSRKAY